MPTQYWFGLKSLPLFTDLHKLWYQPSKKNGLTNKYIKIVPKYLENQFTEITLAFWIMGDGYWETDSQTIFLCTESFTEAEVDFLIEILKKRLDLKASKKKRGNNFRIRFSSKSDNISRLRLLTLSYMHYQMR